MHPPQPPPKSRPVPANFPRGLLPRTLPAIATHIYNARDALELSLKCDQRLDILEAKGEWWFIARTAQGDEGWIPSSYIKLLESLRDPDTQRLYAEWAAAVDKAFWGFPHTPIKEGSFPYLPASVLTCEDPACVARKDSTPLGACIHDVERFLERGVGEGYGYEWLKQQKVAWHPDRFVKKFVEGWKDEGTRAVQEMFVILKELADKAKVREGLVVE